MKDRETSFGTTSFAGMTFGGSLGGRVQRVLALVFGVVLALVLFAVLANPAKAETFTVTKTTDTSDGTCDADCSLREAINAANATAQADTITFASVVRGEILLSNGQLRVESAGGPLRIEGPGADQLAVDGADLSRVFLVTTGAEAEIAGLTVRDGSATYGGGILNGGELTITNTTISDNITDSGGDGGGIDNFGTLTVDSSTISDNTAGYSGAGIYNNPNGELTITNTTISGNDARASGGGIFNDGNGTLTVNNSTISDNTAGSSGGIFNEDGGTVTVTNSTISGNSGGNNGGGISNDPSGTLTVSSSTINGNSANDGAGIFNSGTANIENTIVANSTGPNCRGSINSLGSNLEDADTCNFNQPSDQPNTNPRLGPLQDNGGPTQTHALLADSPAINGVVGGCPPPDTDQRGVTRPQGGACDIGSFELDEAFIQITPSPEDFGNQKIGTDSAPKTFTIKNTGGAELNVDNVDLQGTDPGQFTEQNDQCTGSTLAPRDTCTVEVAFSPNSTGDKSAQLRVESDASSSSNTAQLSGTGTAPGVSLNPTTYDYENQKEGTQSAPQIFTVKNTGEANLDVGVVDIQGADPGQFTEQTDNCEGNTVAPDESCTIEVVFSPDSVGDKSALLRVESDASSSPDEAQLSGNGTATPAPTPPVSNPEPPKPPNTNPKPPSTNNPKPNNPNACTIKGNNRNNILRGTPRRDVICGFGGNDIIRGLGGNDVIRGGRGNDVIFGQRGNDKLYGGGGNDIIYGQAGRDRLYGQRGNDALFGGRGRDVLFGGPGRDFVNDGVKREVKRSVIDAKKAGEQAKKEARKLVNDVLRQVGIRR